MAVQATPAPAAITRAKYADLFVDRLPFMDDILMDAFFPTKPWFGGCRSGKTDTSTVEAIARMWEERER